MTEAEELAAVLGLAPHPEGGWFAESYRSAETLPAAGLPPRFGAPRSASTAIYFLLPAGARSLLHRIKSDELWHFYLGGPLRLTQLFPDGRVEEAVLGRDLAAGQRLQHAVPAGCWFGAAPEPGAPYALVGCTVAPGFDFADFDLGRRADLLARFPGARAAVERLT